MVFDAVKVRDQVDLCPAVEDHAAGGIPDRHRECGHVQKICESDHCLRVPGGFSLPSRCRSHIDPPVRPVEKNRTIFQLLVSDRSEERGDLGGLHGRKIMQLPPDVSHAEFLPLKRADRAGSQVGLDPLHRARDAGHGIPEIRQKILLVQEQPGASGIEQKVAGPAIDPGTHKHEPLAFYKGRRKRLRHLRLRDLPKRDRVDRPDALRLVKTDPHHHHRIPEIEGHLHVGPCGGWGHRKNLEIPDRGRRPIHPGFQPRPR